jgi:hypothetical protein
VLALGRFWLVPLKKTAAAAAAGFAASAALG